MSGKFFSYCLAVGGDVTLNDGEKLMVIVALVQVLKKVTSFSYVKVGSAGLLFSPATIQRGVGWL